MSVADNIFPTSVGATTSAPSLADQVGSLPPFPNSAHKMKPTRAKKESKEGRKEDEDGGKGRRTMKEGREMKEGRRKEDRKEGINLNHGEEVTATIILH